MKKSYDSKFKSRVALEALRDNLLKPMKQEIVSSTESCSVAQKKTLSVLLWLIILNTIAIFALLFKTFF